MPVLHFASFEVITFRRKAPFELTAAYADEKMLPQGTPKAWPVGPGVKFQSGMQQSIVPTVSLLEFALQYLAARAVYKRFVRVDFVRILGDVLRHFVGDRSFCRHHACAR